MLHQQSAIVSDIEYKMNSVIEILALIYEGNVEVTESLIQDLNDLYLELEVDVHSSEKNQEKYLDGLNQLNKKKDQLLQTQLSKSMTLSVDLLAAMMSSNDLESLEALLPDLKDVLQSVERQTNMLSAASKDEQTKYFEFVVQLEKECDQLLQTQLSKSMTWSLDLLEAMMSKNDLESLEALLPELKDVLQSVERQTNMLSAASKDEQTRYFEFVVQLEKECDQLLQTQLSKSMTWSLDLLEAMMSKNDLESLEALLPDLKDVLQSVERQTNMLSAASKDEQTKYFEFIDQLKKEHDELMDRKNDLAKHLSVENKKPKKQPDVLLVNQQISHQELKTEFNLSTC